MGTNELIGSAAAESSTPFDRVAAFEALTDRCLDDAYRLATVVLRDAVEAQDAVHNAALLAFRRFGTLRDRDRFEAWFGRIVLNQCRDRLRSRRRDVARDAALRAELPRSQPGGFDAVERRDAIGSAYMRLSPDLQIVVALRFWRDLKLEAISELLAIPLGTVKSRLNAAEKRLRLDLERAGWIEGEGR